MLAGSSLRAALVIVDGAFTIFSAIDVLLIGAILSVSAVGLFQAAYRLAGLLYFIGLPLRSAVSPRLSRGGGGPDHVALERRSATWCWRRASSSRR